MLSTNKEMKKVMKSNRTSESKIETMSLKYLDMFGWLLRYLTQDINQVSDDINKSSSYPLLIQLGILHRKMGINIQHFGPMLRSLHETFTYYFPKNYNIQVKYSIDVIFTMAAQIMTQQSLNKVFYLNDVAKNTLNDDKDHNMDFLESLEKCLKSAMGREYFYKYLQQSICDEIIIYLQLIAKFHSQTSDKERFMVARDIIRTR